jgi:hypothetical protein
MKQDISYEPVDHANYQRIITALETEIGRLKGELLPSRPTNPIERDRQHTVWLELDRVTRYLAQIREKVIGSCQ